MVLKNFRRSADWAVIALTVAGLAIRLWRIQGGILADDWVTLQLSTVPWSDFVRYLGLENTPPLFYGLARLWLGIVPDTETWMRLLPLSFSVASIPLSYRLFRRLFPEGAALFGTALFTLAASNIIEAHDVRAYSLTLLLALLSLTAFLDWCQSGTRRALVLTAVFTTLGLYTHLQFGLVVAAQQLFVWTDRRLRRQWRPWIIASLVSLGFFLPWLAHFIRSQAAGSGGAVWMTSISSTRLTQIGTWITNLFPRTDAGWTLPLVALGVAVPVCATVLVGLTRRSWEHSTAPGLRLMVILVATAVAAGLLTNIDAPKYYVVAFIGGDALLIFLYSRLRPQALANTFALLLIGVLISLVPTAVARSVSPWPQVASLLEQRAEPDDMAIVHPFLDREVLDWYVDRPLIIEGLLPLPLRTPDRFADILRHNFRPVINPDTIGVLETLTANRQRVWYVSGLPAHSSFFASDLPPRWLQQHGWSAQPNLAPADWGVIVVLFTRDPSAVNEP